MEQQAKKPQNTVTTAMLFRVVFSFSILSLFMFYSSSLIHLHVLRSCKFKLYSLPSDTNKNFMFLLCNGILCIIFNSSGLIRPSMESEADMDKNKQPERENVVVVETSEAEGMRNRPETEKDQRNHEGEEEKEEHGRRTRDREVAHVTAIDEDEAENDEEMLSLEELNKKCDDFIKRMKLEIRFEDA